MGKNLRGVLDLSRLGMTVMAHNGDALVCIRQQRYRNGLKYAAVYYG